MGTVVAVTLDSLLGRALPAFRRQELVDAVLSDPSIFPRRGTSLDRARELRNAGPRYLGAGETLLLSVIGQEAVAFRASPVARNRDRALPLDPGARSTAVTARDVAVRDAASLKRPHAATHGVQWFGRPIAPVGVAPPDSLDGTSYGLAFALGEISSLEGRPLRSDVVALGAIDAEGSVLPVEGIEAKARSIREWLLGIGTVLVAPGEADVFRSGLGETVEVLEVATVAQARDLALATPPHPSLPWTDEHEARTLLVLALEERPSKPTWSALATRAGALIRRSGSATPSAWARLAGAVTTRHVGGDPDSEAFCDPCVDQLPRALRAKVKAHRLQSLADSAADDAVAIARREIDQVRRAILRVDSDDPSLGELRDVAIDCIREERMILGAAARCVSIDDPRSAADLAEAVVEGWFLNLEPASASHALALRLRCLGVLRERTAFEDTIDRFVFPLRDAAPNEWSSQAYIDYELARAWVLLGEPSRALEELEPYREHGSRADAARALETHIRRWVARVRVLQGDRDAADEERASLWSRSVDGAPGARVQQLLARLDQALERDLQTEGVLEELRAHPTRGSLVRAILRSAPSGAGARWLADAYPY